MVQFGTRTLFVATVIVAMSIPAFLHPGGVYLYLPMLLVFLLMLAMAVLLFNWYRAPVRPPLLTQRRLLAVALLLFLTISAFVMLYDVALERYALDRFNESQKQRVLNIRDFERLRDVCLDLHASLTTKPGAERTVDGASEDLPGEIKALNPILITASDHYINIQVTRNGGSVLAYPLDGTFPHVSSRKLADCLYYWPD